VPNETAEKIARRLSGRPSCPECGYVPEEGEKLYVSDWNLHSGAASVSAGNELSDPHFRAHGDIQGKGYGEVSKVRVREP